MNKELAVLPLSLRNKCPYSELFCSKCGKMQIRITPNTDTFHAVCSNVMNEFLLHFQDPLLINLCSNLYPTQIIINLSPWFHRKFDRNGYVFVILCFTSKCPCSSPFCLTVLGYLKFFSFYRCAVCP